MQAKQLAAQLSDEARQRAGTTQAADSRGPSHPRRLDLAGSTGRSIVRVELPARRR